MFRLTNLLVKFKFFPDSHVISTWNTCCSTFPSYAFYWQEFCSYVSFYSKDNSRIGMTDDKRRDYTVMSGALFSFPRLFVFSLQNRVFNKRPDHCDVVKLK